MSSAPPSSPDPFSDPDKLLRGWLTRSELASELGVSKDTLAKWATQGVGPAFIRVGPRVLYRVATVREWLAGLEDRKLKRGAK